MVHEEIPVPNSLPYTWVSIPNKCWPTIVAGIMKKEIPTQRGVVGFETYMVHG